MRRTVSSTKSGQWGGTAHANYNRGQLILKKRFGESTEAVAENNRPRNHLAPAKSSSRAEPGFAHTSRMDRVFYWDNDAVRPDKIHILTVYCPKFSGYEQTFQIKILAANSHENARKIRVFSAAKIHLLVAVRTSWMRCFLKSILMLKNADSNGDMLSRDIIRPHSVTVSFYY